MNKWAFISGFLFLILALVFFHDAVTIPLTGSNLIDLIPLIGRILAGFGCVLAAINAFQEAFKK